VGQNNNSCSELFFSEITFGKVAQSYGLFDLNYAVEIYNPTSAQINLTNYSFQLANQAGTLTTIPLMGTLASNDVVVVSNASADLNMKTLCDLLSANLDFENSFKYKINLLHYDYTFESTTFVVFC
jgi:hypothetical protein